MSGHCCVLKFLRRRLSGPKPFDAFSEWNLLFQIPQPLGERGVSFSERNDSFLEGQIRGKTHENAWVNVTL